LSVAPRLLLINPAMRPASNGQGVAGAATMEPLGLAYVAALTPSHWQIRLVDELAGDDPLCPDGFQPDLVGISSLSPTAPRAYELAAHWRRRGVPVVLGGMHATLCPEEAAAYVDCVFKGEAEGAWPELIADFEAGALRPLYDGGASDLARSPLPRRDLYRRSYRVALVSASRGCRYRCEFCAVWRFGQGRLRTRPVEAVLAELAQGRRGYVTLFTDDNICADREYSLALFRAIAERGLRRRYAVQASLNIADDDELLAALKAAGCFVIMVGLESVNEATLRAMRKGVNLSVGVERYQEKIERLHARGLMVAATFILGGDGDGPDIFARTAEFVLKAGVDLAHFGLLMPTPGTDLFERLRGEGRLLYTDFPKDYARLDLNSAQFIPSGMTTEDAERGLRAATRAISAWPVALRRALRTWRATANPAAAAISLIWTRTGLHARVFNYGS
jgi:radical SAM superfamily enzyme YgiQ (UPF0313 family)